MTTQQTTTIYDLEKSLKTQLDEQREEIKNDKYPTEYVDEIVESTIPIYHQDLLEVSSSNVWFALEQADWGDTPIEQIRCNICQHLSEVAWDWAENNNLEL